MLTIETAWTRFAKATRSASEVARQAFYSGARAVVDALDATGAPVAEFTAISGELRAWADGAVATRPGRPSAIAMAAALSRRAQLDKDARASLAMTAAADGVDTAEMREQAAYLLAELDAAARMRAQVARVEGQRDYLQSKIGILAHALDELACEPLDETCTNAECPIGCPESHAVDYSAAEDAAAARVKIEALQAVRHAAADLDKAVGVANQTTAAEDLVATFNGYVLPARARLAEALGKVP